MRLALPAYTFGVFENAIGAGNSLSSWNAGSLRGGTVV